MPVLHWVRVRKAGWLVDHSRRLHNWFAVTLLGLPSPESSPGQGLIWVWLRAGGPDFSPASVRTVPKEAVSPWVLY